MKDKPRRKIPEKSIQKKVKCWEMFQCNEQTCPAYKSRNIRCWLFSGTHCRSEIQGKFLEKMELCTQCKVFKKNIDPASIQKTLATVDKQFREYKEIVQSRDRDLESMSMELALSLSEVFEALKKISSGDPTVRIPEESTIELINKLKYIVNLTAREIGEIVDQSHEFAIALAEHFDVLHKVSKGDLSARVFGESQVELLESLKRITNEMIESISQEITKRQQAETELLQAYDNLEQRVRERTTELQVINERLWHEIAEREKAEGNLREAELQYRTVADFTHDWEYWEAPDKELRYVSPASERITGYKASEFVENPDLLNTIIYPEDKDIWAAHHHEALKETDLRDITFRIQRKNGTVCWIEHVCRPVIDSNGNFLGVRASNRDITMRKKAEEKLRDSEQLLLQAHKMEALGRLAAGIAHEINNPLAIINEKAGLIKDFLEFSGDIAQDKEKFLGLIQGIFESVGRCRTITHRLLGFSRRVDVAYNTIDLNDTLKEVIEFVEKEMLYKNIRLEMDLREDIPNITSDKGQLQQVFLNILNNAVDAVDKGGVITIKTDMRDSDTVMVSIQDSGHGIPEQILKHIFEPFYTTKDKGRGTGLGLSISYGIIRKLGGNILVKSAVNQGTTFNVEFPVVAKN